MEEKEDEKYRVVNINFFKKGMIKTGDWLNNLFKKSGSKPKK